MDKVSDDGLVWFREVSFAANRKQLLRDVSFQLHSGEIVTLVGPNGAGKTTLLKLLIGALRPSEGKITLSPSLRIGYMPQKLAIDPTLPIDLASFLRLASHGSPGAMVEALANVGMEDKKERQLRNLSGGEFQRALLARALIGRPNLLVLDEPAQGIDYRGQNQLYQLIEQQRKFRNMTVLMASHDLNIVMASSDRVFCINGHICCHGSPEQVSEHPEYRRIFGEGEAESLALYRHRHDHTH